jgi:hypothetical protein
VGTRSGTPGSSPHPYPHPYPRHLTSPNHRQGPTHSRTEPQRKPPGRGVGTGAHRVPPLPEPLSPHPKVGERDKSSDEAGGVRHEHLAKAHASSHHAGTAHPLSCGEADNRGEAIGQTPARIRRFSAGWLGFLYLPRSSAIPGMRGGNRRDAGRPPGSGGVSSVPAQRSCFPLCHRYWSRGGSWVGEVVGKLPRRPECFPASPVTFSSSSW